MHRRPGAGPAAHADGGRAARHRRGRVPSRGSAKAGGEDLVAAAQHFDAHCPELPGIILYGVSMGANMSGLALATAALRGDGRPLFDYWVAVEGAHNIIETYQEARAAAPANEFARVTAEDIATEMGGPYETAGQTYLERANVRRTADMAASGVRGVILVHAYEDGTVPYDQSVEMARGLRDAGVPTDFYSVGRHGAGEPGTTLGSHGGVPTGMAGHGWEGSTTQIVIRAGFDRLHGLITRGDPAPCDRDFRIDDDPAQVTLTLARQAGGRCRFLGRSGRLGPARPCGRPVEVAVRGRESFRLRLPRRLPPGRYVARAAAVDRAGNAGRASRPVRFRRRPPR